MICRIYAPTDNLERQPHQTPVFLTVFNKIISCFGRHDRDTSVKVGTDQKQLEHVRAHTLLRGKRLDASTKHMIFAVIDPLDQKFGTGIKWDLMGNRIRNRKNENKITVKKQDDDVLSTLRYSL